MTKAKSPKKLISIRDVAELTDLSESVIRRKIKDRGDNFPRPLKIGRRRPFVLGEISAYLDSLIKSRGKQPAA